ncbi:unnamed protein product [Rotaria socialis]|nr:unnamed protein product [Rotaria socialis]CAF3359528.1 unnamed protein product [Rotaria socialis]
MATSSKRVANQQQQQSVPEDDDYDEYIYYPYYPKSRPDGGYEYVQEPNKSDGHEKSTQHYYDENVPNNSTHNQRT